jgi:hypothetical protein
VMINSRLWRSRKVVYLLMGVLSGRFADERMLKVDANVR